MYIFATAGMWAPDAGAQSFFCSFAALVVSKGRHRTHRVSGGPSGGRRWSAIALEFLVPPDTGLQPPWAMSVSFATTVSGLRGSGRTESGSRW